MKINLQYIQRFISYLTENAMVTIIKTNQFMLHTILITIVRFICKT
jgi:hypothetical protein